MVGWRVQFWASTFKYSLFSNTPNWFDICSFKTTCTAHYIFESLQKSQIQISYLTKFIGWCWHWFAWVDLSYSSIPKSNGNEKETCSCMIFKNFFLDNTSKLIISKLLKGENLEYLFFFISISLFLGSLSSQCKHISGNKNLLMVTFSHRIW